MADREPWNLATVPQGPASEALFGADLSEGAQVGPYVVASAGRRGGFATVYRVHHYRDGGPPSALKVLHQALCHSPKMLQRFEREIEVLRRVHHPNIVQVIDCGALPDGRSFYVMPWIEGTPLDELIAARGACSPEEVLALFERLAGALRAAHAQGIVHRDLKPANMVVTPGAAPGASDLYLLDFGIAKIVTGDETSRHDLTSTGSYLGTPHYMAPEQITGDEIGAATDVYALGVLLFQLVTGRLPFTAPTPLEVEVHHLHTPPPRPSDHARVSPGFDEVVVRCLAKEPGARYASVDELMEALRGAIGARPAAGAPAPREDVAVALHVEAAPLGDDPGDDELDELDELLSRARERCAGAGLEIPISSGRAFVAILPAGGDPAEAVTLGLELVAAVTGSVRLAATVHRATASRNARGELVGGELARPADWIAAPSATGVWATDAALEGAGDRFEVAPGERPRRIVARR